MSIHGRHLAAVPCVIAMALFVQAAWVPLKAQAGQWLLEYAWQATAGGQTPKPWPWADTRPVAVLEIPRLGLRQLVLDGASDRNLAWGPTALTPAEHSDVVLSGHRDTHFSSLGKLQPGDELRLTGPQGTRHFRVRWLDIVDSRRQELVLEPGRERLTLVTCYPFDAPVAGGPLRLVVTALPVSPTGHESSKLSGNARAEPLAERLVILDDALQLDDP